MLEKSSLIKVMVVDDDITFREHFCQVLSSDEKIEVIGAAASGREAVETARAKNPDIVRYPYYASRVATVVAEGRAQRGLLICSTGIGMPRDLARAYRGGRSKNDQ